MVKLTAEKSGFTDTVPRAIERQSARAHRCAPALRHDHPLAGARGCTLRPARAAARRRRAPSFPPSSLCPEISGLAPTWGSASSGPDRLWSAHGARGLAPKHEFEAGRRLEGELGYGLGPFGDRFTGTPKHRLRALGWGAGRAHRLAVHLGRPGRSRLRGQPRRHAPGERQRQRRAVRGWHRGRARGDAQRRHSLVRRGGIPSARPPPCRSTEIASAPSAWR